MNFLELKPKVGTCSLVFQKEKSPRLGVTDGRIKHDTTDIIKCRVVRFKQPANIAITSISLALEPIDIDAILTILQLPDARVGDTA